MSAEFWAGFAAAALVALAVFRPWARHKFGDIQQHCAREGKSQVDDTARVLRAVQARPDMLRSLLYGRKPQPKC